MIGIEFCFKEDIIWLLIHMFNTDVLNTQICFPFSHVHHDCDCCSSGPVCGGDQVFVPRQRDGGDVEEILQSGGVSLGGYQPTLLDHQHMCDVTPARSTRTSRDVWRHLCLLSEQAFHLHSLCHMINWLITWLGQVYIDHCVPYSRLLCDNV